DREQRAVVRPVDVVDPETERNLVALDLLRAVRQAHERLAPPRGHVERLAVVRQLDAVRARGLAAGHLLPLAARVPFPELAVRLNLDHLLTRVGRGAAREVVSCVEADDGELEIRIQADRLGRVTAAVSDLRGGTDW